MTREKNCWSVRRAGHWAVETPPLKKKLKILLASAETDGSDLSAGYHLLAHHVTSSRFSLRICKMHVSKTEGCSDTVVLNICQSVCDLQMKSAKCY